MPRKSLRKSLPPEVVHMESIQERLISVRGDKSRRAFADALGITESTLRNYEKGMSLPNSDIVVKICAHAHINAEWLLTGTGPMRAENAEKQPVPFDDWHPTIEYKPPQTDDPWKNTKWQSVPLVGLANCGDTGWFISEPLAVRVDLPIDYPYTADMFAVLAMGASMQPEGIRQGYVVFCNPSASIEVGDAVYIEKNDRISAIKKYLKTENGTVHLQGWHPPDKDGQQCPYFEEINSIDIKRMSCVVIVKRKA